MHCQYLNDATPTLCDSCYNGYTLTTLKTNCGSTIENCKSLNDTDPNKCDACVSTTYTLTDDYLGCFASMSNCAKLLSTNN